MKKKVEKLYEKIDKKKPLIGSSTTFTDCSITEFLAEVGFDFIWIDMEHTSIDKKDVELHLMATRGTDCAGIIRVPWNDKVLVKPILEMGPDGVIFPFINNAEEAREAVNACKYPPEGFRGFGPRKANNYGLMEMNKYVENSYSSFMTIVQIENVEAVENLEEIVSVKGIDAIMVGPMDLSGSLGLLGETKHKKVKETMDKIGDIVSGKDIVFGAVAGNDPEIAKEWLDRGADMIRIGTDISLIRKAACEVYDKMDKKLRK